jgi:hypothetical protein
MNITELEKQTCPQCNQLNQEEGVISSTMLDMELDPIELRFNYDGCVEINSGVLNYITLSVRHLENLILLIKEADNMYVNSNKN